MPFQRMLMVLVSGSLLALLASFVWTLVQRVPEPRYTVLQREGDFELRAYEPRVVAVTLVEGDADQALSVGFRRLFQFIAGANTQRVRIEMTSPVTQRAVSRKLDMTAPVVQQRTARGWRIAFVMPHGETLETLPTPLDPRVVLERIPPTRAVVVRDRGRFNDAHMAARAEDLRAWALRRGLTLRGEPEFLRYDAPWTLWILRRNEALFDLEPDA